MGMVTKLSDSKRMTLILLNALVSQILKRMCIRYMTLHSSTTYILIVWFFWGGGLGGGEMGDPVFPRVVSVRDQIACLVV